MFTDKQQEEIKIIDLGMCLRVAMPTNNKMDDHDDDDDDQQQRQPPPPRPVPLVPQPCNGKPGYVAPEVMREEACDPFASDVWSLGVCLYAMLTGRPLYRCPQDATFNATTHRGGVDKVIKIYEGTLSGQQFSPCARALICQMLSSDPRARPTLEEILVHPFLSSSPGAKVRKDWRATANRMVMTSCLPTPLRPTVLLRRVREGIASIKTRGGKKL